MKLFVALDVGRRISEDYGSEQGMTEINVDEAMRVHGSVTS